MSGERRKKAPKYDSSGEDESVKATDERSDLEEGEVVDQGASRPKAKVLKTPKGKKPERGDQNNKRPKFSHLLTSDQEGKHKRNRKQARDESSESEMEVKGPKKRKTSNPKGKGSDDLFDAMAANSKAPGRNHEKEPSEDEAEVIQRRYKGKATKGQKVKSSKSLPASQSKTYDISSDTEYEYEIIRKKKYKKVTKDEVEKPKVKPSPKQRGFDVDSDDDIPAPPTSNWADSDYENDAIRAQLRRLNSASDEKSARVAKKVMLEREAKLLAKMLKIHSLPEQKDGKLQVQTKSEVRMRKAKLNDSITHLQKKIMEVHSTDPGRVGRGNVKANPSSSPNALDDANPAKSNQGSARMRFHTGCKNIFSPTRFFLLSFSSGYWVSRENIGLET